MNLILLESLLISHLNGATFGMNLGCMKSKISTDNAKQLILILTLVLSLWYPQVLPIRSLTVSTCEPGPCYSQKVFAPRISMSRLTDPDRAGAIGHPQTGVLQIQVYKGQRFISQKLSYNKTIAYQSQMSLLYVLC